MQTKLQEKFKALFGKEGRVFASAGRINLIGEHTDYNGMTRMDVAGDAPQPSREACHIFVSVH